MSQQERQNMLMKEVRSNIGLPKRTEHIVTEVITFPEGSVAGKKILGKVTRSFTGSAVNVGTKIEEKNPMMITISGSLTAMQN